MIQDELKRAVRKGVKMAVQSGNLAHSVKRGAARGGEQERGRRDERGGGEDCTAEHVVLSERHPIAVTDAGTSGDRQVSRCD